MITFPLCCVCEIAGLQLSLCCVREFSSNLLSFLLYYLRITCLLLLLHFPLAYAGLFLACLIADPSFCSYAASFSCTSSKISILFWIIWMQFFLFVASDGFFYCLSSLMLIVWMQCFIFVPSDELFEWFSTLMLDCLNVAPSIRRLSWITFPHVPLTHVYLIPNYCLAELPRREPQPS